jgi:hypothetical protein
MSMIGLKKFLDDLAGPDHPFVKQLEEMTSLAAPVDPVMGKNRVFKLKKDEPRLEVPARILRLNKN